MAPLGLPKGVELTHYNLTAVCSQMSASRLRVHPPSEDPSNYLILGVMPHYHVYGGVMLVFYPLTARSPSIILPKFEPEPYLEAIQKYKPSVSVYSSPSISTIDQPVSIFSGREQHLK